MFRSFSSMLLIGPAFQVLQEHQIGKQWKAYDLLQGSFFPECVARVRSTLRLRPHPSATVRNCSREVAIWPCLWRVSARVTLGGFTCHVNLVSRGSRGFSWHSDVFRNVVESGFVRQGAILLQRFQKMSGRLRGRRSTLDVSVFILRGRRSTRRVLWLVFWVFCESHCQGCLKWWQGANSVAGVAFCEMCWKLMEALHETSILR